MYYRCKNVHFEVEKEKSLSLDLNLKYVQFLEIIDIVTSFMCQILNLNSAIGT